jgi:hypothetical protein
LFNGFGVDRIKARFHLSGKNRSDPDASEGVGTSLSYAAVKPELQKVMYFI